jgi:hypothetical protein
MEPDGSDQVQLRFGIRDSLAIFCRSNGLRSIVAASEAVDTSRGNRISTPCMELSGVVCDRETFLFDDKFSTFTKH